MCYNEIVKRPISVRHAKGDFNFTVVTHMIFAMRFVFLPRRRQFFLRKTGQTWTPEEVPFRLKWSIFKNTKQINNLRTVEREGNSTFTVLFHVKFTYCGNKLISFNTGRTAFGIMARWKTSLGLDFEDKRSRETACIYWIALFRIIKWDRSRTFELVFILFVAAQAIDTEGTMERFTQAKKERNTIYFSPRL